MKSSKVEETWEGDPGRRSPLQVLLDNEWRRAEDGGLEPAGGDVNGFT